jgi:rhamnosyltransferase
MKIAAPSPTRINVAGVVVTYFPDDDFANRLAAIAEETQPVVIVDNSADPDVRTRLRAVCSAQRAHLVENAENLGIGAALNEAFRLLIAEGYEWAIAFDQDSEPQLAFTSALLEVASGAEEKPAAVIGANWHDEARPDAYSRHLRRNPRLPLGFVRSIADHDLREVTCVITSGSLFHLPTWRELGGFDPGLFLDLVDTEYCLRARNAGRDVRVAARARLRHRRGAKRPVRFAGRTWWPAFMPESRLFLLFRNRLFVFRRHGLRFPHWMFFELVYATKLLVEIVFLEDRKISKLHACLRGTWAGFRRAPVLPSRSP